MFAVGKSANRSAEGQQRYLESVSFRSYRRSTDGGRKAPVTKPPGRLLRTDAPPCEGLEIASYCAGARGALFGGDFWVAQNLPDGRVAFAVADALGSGPS